jgi:hypothetical protein
MTLLAWSLVPGGFEVVEDGVHLALYGDFVHDQSTGRNHQPFKAEHGCGGGFHLCSCCLGQLAEPAAERISFSSLSLVTSPPVMVEDYREPGYPRNPEEPPRA